MGLFSRSKESPVLQKGYDDAYNLSLQSILKEGNHQYDDALTSWRYTLDGINTCLRNIDPVNLKSSTDKSLYANLKDIERQCSDRIRYLDVKTGGAPANPYGTGMASGSSASIVKKSTGSVNRVAVGSKSPVPPPKTSSSGGNGPVASATSSPKSRATKSQPALPRGYVYNNSRQQPSSSAAHLAWGQKRGKGSPKVDEDLFTGFDGIQRTDSTGSTHRHTGSVPSTKLEPSPLLESAMAKVGQNRAQGIPQPQRQQRQGARFIITRSSPSLTPRTESPRQPHPTAALAAKRQAAAAAGHNTQQRSGNNSNNTNSRPKDPVPITTEPERSPSPEIDDWDKAALEKLKGLRGVDEHAAKQILAEVVLKGDPVHWDDIAGLERAKSSLKETVVYPFLRPDLFSGLREPALGMLLFGPPGTGKTMLARAVATESHSTFFSISASSLTSKFMGESEKLVRALFQMAKALAPSIIFVDEIDSILTARSDSGEHEASRRIKTEFLVQWSDLQAAASGKAESESRRVLVLGATNLPWAIDEAARRRFVRRQYIPLPEEETRRSHLLKLLNHQKHALVPADVETLVAKTDGYSGSDLTALAKDAAMGPLRSLGEALLTTDPDQIRPMDLGDFIESMKTIRASVSPSGLREFEKWAENFGSSGA